MKYSKAIAVAVAALSVMSLAAAADPTCTKEQVVKGAECVTAPSPLPKNTKITEVKVGDKFSNKLECVAPATVVKGEDIFVNGCCIKIENDKCVDLPPAPKEEDKVACGSKHSQPHEGGSCTCVKGTKKDANGHCIIQENDETGCKDLLNRKWVTVDGKAACAAECVDDKHIRPVDPKNATNFYTQMCYLSSALPSKEACDKAANFNRTYNEETKYCVCKQGFETVYPEEYIGVEPCVKASSASTLIMSSTAVLAFIGSMAYLL